MISILINYIFACFKQTYTKLQLFMIVCLNLFPLIHYKYSTSLSISEHSLVLPLAISFFTFQQIAFQVDLYRGKIYILDITKNKKSFFRDYLFFVLFFPQLIAGPIVHFNELISQIKNKSKFSINSSYLSAGTMLFSIGLFSKVVIADNLALDSHNSWSDLFSYSFMIYFDFSGYASMAIGLALMFGVILPINFNSPYKANNLIDFWRRWHITLSTFLKDHIYIPLGGNKFGLKKQTIALMATMVIGGIWHGSGITFILWGAFHGLGLVFLNLIKDFKNIPKVLGVIFTFLYVSLLWVLFFSSDFKSAVELYKVLFSADGFSEFNYWLIVVALLVWFLPNSTQVVDLKQNNFNLKPWYGYVTGILMFISLKFMAETPSMSFVYFNF
ncbi:MAG: MBOAT family O-acyltransferase [Campylobacterota bacterium]|nr:MBOAT family O-acyltransferase [Campylobacterota bacterium]